MRKIVHRPSLRMTNLLNRELDKTRTPLLSQQEEALNAYCRHNIGATTGPPGVGEPNQGNKAHTRNKSIHSKSSKREEKRRQCQCQGRGQKDWSWINRKAIGFLLSFNRPMSGLASQAARVSPGLRGHGQGRITKGLRPRGGQTVHRESQKLLILE